MKTIDFFSSVPGVAEAHPIVKAKDILPEWVKKCRADYVSTKPNIHLAKCPGIFDLYNFGYVVPMWCDAVIETKGDTFRWATQDHIKHLKRVDHPMDNIPVISNHSFGAIAKFLPRRPQSIANIIKVDTPWGVCAPKGVKFLVMPFPYSDFTEFDACPGILDPAISTEINVQMYWNVKDRSYTIKAGTPMQIIVPLTEHNYKFNVRDATEKDELWLRKKNYLAHHKFNIDRHIMRNAYNNFFNKDKPWWKLF
jgi:hypothetical protein